MQEWIEQEFSSCDLGDRRLDDRLKTIYFADLSRSLPELEQRLPGLCRSGGVQAFFRQ